MINRVCFAGTLTSVVALLLIAASHLLRVFTDDGIVVAVANDIRRRHKIAKELLCGSSHFTCPANLLCALCRDEMACDLTSTLDRLHGMYRCFDPAKNVYSMPVKTVSPKLTLRSNNGEALALPSANLVTLENVDTLY